MLKILSSFITILFIVFVLKWLIPSQVSDIATEILVDILTIIRDSVAHINLPQ